MLVTMKEILDRANEGNYAVIAPNVGHELNTRPVIEAAEELNSPLIIDVAFGATPDIVFFGDYLVKLCKESSVPIAINLDHGGSKDAPFEEVLEQALLAIKAGFTSIMADRSSKPYDQNVSEVKRLVEIAHTIGVTVEAELGHVGSAHIYEEEGNLVYTDPQEAKAYIEATGIDALAVSIGTAHGAYVGGKKPVIQFDRLKELKEATKFPLVLHGGSGTGDENLEKVCRMGINKVNISNDLHRWACDYVTNYDTSGDGAYQIWALIQKGIKDRMKELIKIAGSDGKAWDIKPKGIGTSMLAIIPEHINRIYGLGVDESVEHNA